MTSDTPGLCRYPCGAHLEHDLAPDGTCRRCKRQIVETRASRKAEADKGVPVKEANARPI